MATLLGGFLLLLGFIVCLILKFARTVMSWEQDGGVRDHVCDWLNGPIKVFNKNA